MRARFGYVILLVLLVISPVISVGSEIVRALEYRTSVPIVTRVSSVATPPSTVTFSIDRQGHKHVNANVYLAIQMTDSVQWVQHIYILGQMADWLQALDALETFRDIYNEVVVVPLLLALAIFNMRHFLQFPKCSLT